MVEMLETVSEAVSIKSLSPNDDIARFYTNVVQPGTPLAIRISYERFPNLTFTCPPNRIPIVSDLSYRAANCDLNLGAPFRFRASVLTTHAPAPTSSSLCAPALRQTLSHLLTFWKTLSGTH